MGATKTLTPKELAEDMGTDAKTLRKFLREYFSTHEMETPGQGGRYAISASDARKIKKAFSERVTAPKAPKGEKGDEAEEIEGDELETIDTVEEPTAEDLDEEFEDLDEVEA